MSSAEGVVAAGHPATVDAACAVLQAGGNAFDAVIAAHFAACVAEPVLASLGGGGFLLARSESQGTTLYDFFTHTPLNPNPSEVDFHPIEADFGPITQEFHIGLGSIATPGTVHGLFTIHQELGSMPLGEIIEPACQLARDGVEMNQLQAYIFEIIQPILKARTDSRQLYCSKTQSDRLLQEGEILRNPAYADLLQALAHEGSALFYEGEVAATIERSCREAGGHLSREDLRKYRTARRQPLEQRYRDHTIYTNPPPSCGGILIAFALQLLENFKLDATEFGSLEHLLPLVEVMRQTNKARIDSGLDDNGHLPEIGMLLPDFVASYRQNVLHATQCLRGTTHFSVIDRAGNVAAMTVSNGEGSGFLIPDTGVMLNNMLGEEDLHPGGFHNWQPDRRIVSMMAPTLVTDSHGGVIALGSGGSNRIRSAILQTLINLIDFALPLPSAVKAPRLHFERELLNLEPGVPTATITEIQKHVESLKIWDDSNLFFGGVHAVARLGRQGELIGIGDPRRGGHMRHIYA